MATNGKKENILTSWKEIAAYLDRDVRTCVRWEQRYGLPVHRLERDSKAKVFAYKEQIDQWLAERSARASAPPACRVPNRHWFRPFPVLFALAGLAAAAYFLFLRPHGGAATDIPTDFHLRGSELVVVDGRGGELWRFDTRVPGLEQEATYRPRFQQRGAGTDYVPVWPYIMFRDINGDGRIETLLTTQTTSEIGEGTLLCLDHRGVETWRFDAGRALEFGSRPYRRDYRIFGFDVEDYDGDGAPEILVIAHHMPDWPCQVALLDAAGKIEGEYWNAGYIMDASAGDLDGDGAKELVISGVNNEYRRGCVAVFEPGGLRGGSPQHEGSYRATAIGDGGQSAYILFPKTDVHRALKQEGDPVNHFWIRDGDGLTAMTTDTEIYFDLDRTLVCHNVTPSNTYRNLLENLSQKGLDLPAPDRDFQKKLESSLLYYGSGRWNNTPMAAAVATAVNPSR